VAKAVRGQPARPRPPVGPPAGAGERNYFASVVEELRKVVWPTWSELGRMTGVVVTTVILMAVIVSAADYGLGFVVKQLYTTSSSTSSGTTGSHVSAQPTVAPQATTAPTSAGGNPVTP
jgi:preprotein translocase SecE subunit